MAEYAIFLLLYEVSIRRLVTTSIEAYQDVEILLSFLGCANALTLSKSPDSPAKSRKVQNN